MTNLLGRMIDWWRERWGGEEPRTYDAACEELGGVPWRIKPEATDRWFVQSRDDEGEAPSPPTLDVPGLPPVDSTMRIRRAPLLTKGVLAGGVAVIAIVASVIAIANGLTSPSVPLPTASVASAAATHTVEATPAAATAPALAMVSGGGGGAGTMVSPSSPSPSLAALHQPSSPKLTGLVRTAPARRVAGPRTSAAVPAKPHLRAVPAKRPLIARARRR